MIGDLFRAHAAELERAGRSRVYVELMRAAGADADAGGDAPAAGAWAAARRTLVEHETVVRRLAQRTVQTNEPGRCVSLYGGLLWLAERHRLPIRLLEIGASAGLNLNADRFRYVVGGAPLGDPERLARIAHAGDVAARHPVAVERCSAAAWLAGRLAEARFDTQTVIWQSVVNQYLDSGEREAIRGVFAAAGGTLAWLTLEPPAVGARRDGSFELRCRERPEDDGSGEARLLAHAGYHGPPVAWEI